MKKKKINKFSHDEIFVVRTNLAIVKACEHLMPYISIFPSFLIDPSKWLDENFTEHDWKYLYGLSFRDANRSVKRFEKSIRGFDSEREYDIEYFNYFISLLNSSIQLSNCKEVKRFCNLFYNASPTCLLSRREFAEFVKQMFPAIYILKNN